MREGKRRNEENLYTLIISGLQHPFSEKQSRRQCLLCALFLQNKGKRVYVSTKKRRKKRNWKDKPKCGRGRKYFKKFSGSQHNIIIKRCPQQHAVSQNMCSSIHVCQVCVCIHRVTWVSFLWDRGADSAYLPGRLCVGELVYILNISTAAIFMYMRKDLNDTAYTAYTAKNLRRVSVEWMTIQQRAS